MIKFYIEPKEIIKMYGCPRVIKDYFALSIPKWYIESQQDISIFGDYRYNTISKIQFSILPHYIKGTYVTDEKLIEYVKVLYKDKHASKLIKYCSYM